MEHSDVRIGHLVTVDGDFTGRVESWDGGWFVRAADGELGGPWPAEELIMATPTDSTR